MELLPDAPPAPRRPVSLRVRVRDAAGRPAALEPYLGMLGHLALRDRAGRVFTHLHPGGSFSMAAQQLFEMREAGLAPRTVELGANDPTCRLPGVEESAAAWAARTGGGADGTIHFPYEFPAPGPYRVWVQVKLDGRVRTGVFDVTAGGPELALKSP
jgi:hypothetical protein